jgi:hypothetical protein
VSRRRYVVPPELEEVRHLVSLLDGRVRWPRDVTETFVVKLRKAGLVPAAIADELELSDAYVERVLREGLDTPASTKSAVT